jgi:hypothetical protein
MDKSKRIILEKVVEHVEVCAPLTAHGGVAPHLNGMAIQVCRILPCITEIQHWLSLINFVASLYC